VKARKTLKLLRERQGKSFNQLITANLNLPERIQGEKLLFFLLSLLPAVIFLSHHTRKVGRQKLFALQ
jgi:hypothetical protein